MQLKLEQYPLLLKALPILDKLHSAGYEAYFVGGAVRDAILGQPFEDIDIATNAKPEQTMSLFEKAIPTGLQHGTVTVVENDEHYEVTTFRHESSYDDYRRPTEVQFVQELKLDLARRDFTMNAMALDRNGDVYDPFQGLEDMRAQTLRAVGNAAERFTEDALRMLRAVRFIVSYQLRPDSELWSAILQHAPLLQHIAMERVCAELNKMLKTISQLSDIKPLIDSGLLAYTKQPLYFSTNWNEKLESFTFSKALTSNAKWAIWLSESSLTIEQLRSDLNHLKMSTADKNLILLWITLTRQYIIEYIHIDNLQQQWLTELLHHDVLSLEYWMEHILTLYDKQQVVAQLQHFHKQLSIYKVKQLAIKGSELAKALKLEPGPWLKAIINELFIAVNLAELSNEKQSLIAYAAARLKAKEASHHAGDK